MSKDRGEWVDPTKARIDVKEWSEQWFRAQVQLKPTTRSSYRHSLDKHVLPRWGQTRLGAVAHGDVQEWVIALAVNLAPSTLRQIHLILSGIIKLPKPCPTHVDGSSGARPSHTTGARFPSPISSRNRFSRAARIDVPMTSFIRHWMGESCATETFGIGRSTLH
ncbi:hypothetical protein E3T47_00330 [Cryobacterium ruanii]|uniref:Core-binding (CB) domain-containing protein n=1 Tax=Cryobacterium ruanii TaxID=1259197 RepID=A0A4R9AUF3_9MICO|nr:hypothetical protein E3T47_00330 [Cryobacterium ruanii]